MIIEKVGFNDKWALGMTESKFVNHPLNQHLWPALTAEQRKKRLREAYQLIKQHAHNK